MAEHIYTYVEPTCEADLRQVCTVLNKGGIIAYPSDVNWALACDPNNKKGIERILSLKANHPKQQPFSLLCDSISMVSVVANVDQITYRILRKLLPGPYTILLARSKNLPKQIKDKRPLVGIRIPKSPLPLAIVNHYQRPLLTSSLSPITYNDNTLNFKFGYQIEEHIGHIIDLIIDLGEEVQSTQSTMIKILDGHVEIIRQGIGTRDGID